MINELQKTIDLLKKINTHSNDSIVSLEELKREQRRLQDFNKLDNEVNNILAKLKNNPSININDIIEEICFLNINIAIYAWHLEQVRNITEKFIGLYRKKPF